MIDTHSPEGYPDEFTVIKYGGTFAYVEKSEGKAFLAQFNSKRADDAYNTICVTDIFGIERDIPVDAVDGIETSTPETREKEPDFIRWWNKIYDLDGKDY